MLKIFSAFVLGATFPNPMLVKLVKVKYKAVIYRVRMGGPLIVSLGRYGIL
jgi:hypothetical protein